MNRRVFLFGSTALAASVTLPVMLPVPTQYAYAGIDFGSGQSLTSWVVLARKNGKTKLINSMIAEHFAVAHRSAA